MTAPHYHSHVDDPAAVGRRLRDARLAAGLSQRISPDLVAEEVARRLGGAAREAEDDRPTQGLDEPARRARVLWEHSRRLAKAGEPSTAVRYAHDALALLDYADDRAELSEVGA